MPRLVAGPPSQAAPSTYKLAPSEAFVPESVTATFDGTGAGGTFLPALSIYSQDGKLIARSPATQVLAGDSAEVTFAPLLRAAAAAAAGGAFTQIARTELAVAGKFDFTGIPATFNHLLLIIVGKLDFSDEVEGIRFNGDSGANYEGVAAEVDDSVGMAELSFPAQTGALIGGFAGNVGAGSTAEGASAYSVWIPEYRGTTFHKLVIAQGGNILQSVAPAMKASSWTMFSRWKSTAAINEISFFGENLLPGSTVTLYGLT